VHQVDDLAHNGNRQRNEIVTSLVRDQTSPHEVGAFKGKIDNARASFTAVVAPIPTGGDMDSDVGKQR
jgi:hypothetical protein